MKIRATLLPNLTYLILTIASDNGIQPIAPFHEWNWPRHARLLERQAAKLTRGQLETLACGEERAQKRIVKRYGVQRLNRFLCEVFDGPRSRDFYQD